MVPLIPRFRFTYRAELDGELVEHEVDHVYTGRFDGAPVPNPAEVTECRWVDPEALAAELARRPETFTAWFRLLVPEVHRRTP